jgi:hypothetical protein
MKPTLAGMPPHLMMLMRRLRDEPLSPVPRLIRSSHGVRQGIDVTRCRAL